MIKLEVIDPKQHHFVVSGNEPFRVEVSLTFGDVVAMVYRGHTKNVDDDPIGAYDGGLDTNRNWVDVLGYHPSGSEPHQDHTTTYQENSDDPERA